MSTKLYNGIKFKSNNIRQVLDNLIELKEKAKVIALELIKDSEIALFIQTNKLVDKDSFDVTSELLSAMDSQDHRRWTFIPNIHFSVVVYPCKDGDIYGYYFDSNKEEFRKLLEPLYDDFHYQNQCDKPDNISDEEWEFREVKWDELIDYKFRDTGLNYDIVTGDDFTIFDFKDRIKVILEKLNREKKINDVLE